MMEGAPGSVLAAMVLTPGVLTPASAGHVRFNGGGVAGADTIEESCTPLASRNSEQRRQKRQNPDVVDRENARRRERYAQNRQEREEPVSCGGFEPPAFEPPTGLADIEPSRFACFTSSSAYLSFLQLTPADGIGVGGARDPASQRARIGEQRAPDQDAAEGEPRAREQGTPAAAGAGEVPPAAGADGEARRQRSWAELEAESLRLLDELHRCGGAPITANSKRLAELHDDPEALRVAKEDTRKDIRDYAHVTMAEGAECVRRFMEKEAALGEMRVCAACGLRDPEVAYHRHKLSSIPDDHWLVVSDAALQVLDAEPPIELLQPRVQATGVWPRIEVHRRSLHNLVSHEGKTFHLIEEATFEEAVGGEGEVRSCEICACCQKRWNKKPPSRAPPAAGCRFHEALDTFYELSGKYAPEHSIAAGADFGRIAGLRTAEMLDVSVLEKLVLARSRCHFVAIKVVADGSETGRQRLHGHTIIFPQEPKFEGCGTFGEAVLKAALGHVSCGAFEPLAL
jgi:hypothetical protein